MSHPDTNPFNVSMGRDVRPDDVSPGNVSPPDVIVGDTKKELRKQWDDFVRKMEKAGFRNVHSPWLRFLVNYDMAVSVLNK